MNTFSRSLLAETYKLKRTPILWIALIGGLFAASLIFLIYYFQVEELLDPGVNPWTKYTGFSLTITATLLLIPFVVLLTSSIVYPEHQGHTWKYLYTLPLQKAQFYCSKLVMVLGLVMITYLIFLLSTLLGGMILGNLQPAYGFQDYTAGGWAFLQQIMHVYIGIAGIVALHYWLSLRWRSFIPPVGIGLLAFVVAMIIAGKTDWGLYFPYCYPILQGQLALAETPERLNIVFWGGLSNIEWYSLGYFVLFTGLGYWEETRKSVK